MKCPSCGHLEDKVVDTRSIREGTATRRRRKCMACGKRFTTYEYIEIPLMIQKHDGRREPFDRSKLKQGIMIAATKRPVSTEALERIVVDVEEKAYETGRPEISSSDVGEIVMDKLKQLDEIAYIRFASVYRRFRDVGEFRRELDKM